MDPTKLPSQRYWDIVTTESDYKKFLATGMAYELEPNTPCSWKEHLEMEEWIEWCRKGREYKKNTSWWS